MSPSMSLVAGSSLLGVKESLFPGKWGSASLKHCLSPLWFLRPKKTPTLRTNFSLLEYPISVDLGKKHLGFFFFFLVSDTVLF